MRSRLVLILVSLSLSAFAEEPKKLKGSKKENAPKLDLGLPQFGEIPKDQKLESAKPKAETLSGPSGTRAEEGYTVVRVVHGKAFMRSPEGSKPSTPYPAVMATSGNPWQTEKFGTVVRVKSPAKRGARIELAILDQRGDTIMEASGELRFPTGSDEAEWQVDWEPTAIRNPGEFQVLVRVGGNPLGTFPFKVVAEGAAPAK